MTTPKIAAINIAELIVDADKEKAPTYIFLQQTFNYSEYMCSKTSIYYSCKVGCYMTVYRRYLNTFLYNQR